MNQLISSRHLLSFIRRFYGVAYKCTGVMCMHHSQTSLFMQSIQMTDFDRHPDRFSYNQLRKYAKKAQGKIPKSGKGKIMKLTDEEMSEVIDIEDFREQLDQVAERLKRDYVENLSIRSAASNIINVMVKIDGEEYPLNELGIISKKNPTLIAINMADFPEAIKAAIQAIVESGSGLNPQQEGTMIYLTVPKMTREHRETLAKNAKSLFVKAKDEIRLIQNSFIKEAKSKTDLSEDLVFNTANQIKMMADLCAGDLEKIMKDKQNELLGDS